MAARRTLSLSPTEKQALEAEARHAAKPYQRERAAALLKIVADHSPHWGARYGLLTARDPDAVHGCLDCYTADRVAHWQVQHGRGRKPAFSPAALAPPRCLASPSPRQRLARP